MFIRTLALLMLFSSTVRALAIASETDPDSVFCAKENYHVCISNYSATRSSDRNYHFVYYVMVDGVGMSANPEAQMNMDMRADTGVVSLNQVEIGHAQHYDPTNMHQLALEVVLDPGIEMGIKQKPGPVHKYCHKSQFGIYSWWYYRSWDRTLEITKNGSTVISKKFNQDEPIMFKTETALFCR